MLCSQPTGLVKDYMEKDAFKMPNAVTIKGRSSSITNSFFNGIVPVVYPTEKEIQEALHVLEQNENDVRCVYCGEKKTEWDHLHPLIVDKNHTGYITEIANLVPACGKCNQSKGNSDWKEWMLGDAKLSPKSRGIKDLSHRIEIIERYDKTFPKKKIDLEQIIGKEKWSEYKLSLKKLEEDMEHAQNIMDEIKNVYLSQYNNSTRTKHKRVVNTENEKMLDNNVRVITVGTVSIRTRALQNEPVQEFLKRTLSSLLENNFIPKSEIEKLKTKEYSKQCFDINFPLLQVSLNEDNRVRYWKDKIYGFYVCSQWYQKKHDDKIEKWILYIDDLNKA